MSDSASAKSRTAALESVEHRRGPAALEPHHDRLTAEPRTILPATPARDSPDPFTTVSTSPRPDMSVVLTIVESTRRTPCHSGTSANEIATACSTVLQLAAARGRNPPVRAAWRNGRCCDATTRARESPRRPTRAARRETASMTSAAPREQLVGDRIEQDAQVGHQVAAAGEQPVDATHRRDREDELAPRPRARKPAVFKPPFEHQQHDEERGRARYVSP